MLTIEPGTQVRFDHTAWASIYGTLNAMGTAGTPITFTRRDPTDEWWGLWFYNGSIGSLENCNIDYATYSTAYGVWATNALSVSLQDCNISNSDYGVFADGFLPTIDGCTISDNNWGIWVQNASSATLSTPNLIQDSTSTGITFDNCSGVSVSNQTITGHSAETGLSSSTIAESSKSAPEM